MNSRWTTRQWRDLATWIIFIGGIAAVVFYSVHRSQLGTQNLLDLMEGRCNRKVVNVRILFDGRNETQFSSPNFIEYFQVSCSEAENWGLGKFPLSNSPNLFGAEIDFSDGTTGGCRIAPSNKSNGWSVYVVYPGDLDETTFRVSCQNRIPFDVELFIDQLREDKFKSRHPEFE